MPTEKGFLMRDFRDREQDRKMEEMYQRQGGGGFDDLWGMLVGAFFVFLAVIAAATFLDHQFGWGLADWIMGQLSKASDGIFGFTTM